MTTRNRFGIFFIAVGGLFVFLFIFSDMAGEATFSYFVLGAVGVLLGIVLSWRTAPPPQRQPSGRFVAVRKVLQRSKKKK
jgi:hypothetical protein